MQCPTDRHELVTKTKKGLTVSECPECNGVWLPNSSLSQPREETSPLPSKKDCPMCSTRMAVVRFKGCLVHRCHDCQHVWVDGAAIQSLLATKPPSRPKLDFLPSYTSSDLIFDILIFAPELVVEGVKGIASATEAVGEVVVDFFGDLLSDIF